jgi:hypothetical protein
MKRMREPSQSSNWLLLLPPEIFPSIVTHLRPIDTKNLLIVLSWLVDDVAIYHPHLLNEDALARSPWAREVIQTLEKSIDSFFPVVTLNATTRLVDAMRAIVEAGTKRERTPYRKLMGQVELVSRGLFLTTALTDAEWCDVCGERHFEQREEVIDTEDVITKVQLCVTCQNNQAWCNRAELAQRFRPFSLAQTTHSLVELHGIRTRCWDKVRLWRDGEHSGALFYRPDVEAALRRVGIDAGVEWRPTTNFFLRPDRIVTARLNIAEFYYDREHYRFIPLL